MTKLFAYDEITLEYGGNAVFLRPSLRAATRLERLHGDFPALLRKIDEFDTRTIRAVITYSTDRAATDTLLTYAAKQPLSGFKQAAQAPMFDLVAALMPQSPEGQTKTESPGTPMPWSEVYRELFKMATGWLGWTPAAAWNATPQEITDAFSAHIAKLKAVHGSAEDDQDTTGPTEEQRKQAEELGLDPEFDRAGLRALKGLSKMREGQVT